MKRKIRFESLLILLVVLWQMPVHAQEDTPGSTDGIVNEFLKERDKAFDGLKAHLLEVEKNPTGNYMEIVRTLRAFGTLGDARAVPLLIARLMFGPSKEGKPHNWAYCDRFPAAEALSKFGTVYLDTIESEAVKDGTDSAMLNLAYYLALTTGIDLGKQYLMNKIAKEDDGVTKAQLQKAQNYLTSGLKFQ
ncbi:MAG: hypothetical protein ACREJ2_09985 [Planctomycetota bacterium]